MCDSFTENCQRTHWNARLQRTRSYQMTRGYVKPRDVLAGRQTPRDLELVRCIALDGPPEQRGNPRAGTGLSASNRVP